VRKRGNRAGSGVGIDEIFRGTGARIPKNWDEYVVTYKLSRKGVLRVCECTYGLYWTPTTVVYKLGKYARARCFVCFLPKSWVGHRVTRTMKVLKKVA